MFSCQKTNSSQKNKSVRKYVTYGLRGAVACAAGYIIYKYLSKGKNHNAQKICALEAAEPISSSSHIENEEMQRKTLLANIIERVEIRYIYNQRLSDITVRRSLYTAAQQLKQMFNVTKVTQKLKCDVQLLSDKEKNTHLETLEFLCIAKLISSMYLILLKLLLCRIHVNILGRRWVQEEIQENVCLMNDPEAMERLQKLINEAWEDAPKLPANTVLTLNSEKDGEDEAHNAENTNLKTSLSSRKKSRSHLYHPDQLISILDKPSVNPENQCTVIPIDTSTGLFFTDDSNSDKDELPIQPHIYKQIVSTINWIQHPSQCHVLPSIVCMVVEKILEDISPHTAMDYKELISLICDICCSIEKILFKRPDVLNYLLFPKDVGKLMTNSNPDMSNMDSSTFELHTDNNDENSIPNFLFHNEQETYMKHNKHLRMEYVAESFSPSTSACFVNDITIVSDNAKKFFCGCIAETQDLVECENFQYVLRACRECFLKKFEIFLSEKCSSTSFNKVPLCRFFGRLCKMSDILLSHTDMELSEENNFFRNMTSNVCANTTNQYIKMFAQTPEVEVFCKNIFAPALMHNF